MNYGEALNEYHQKLEREHLAEPKPERDLGREMDDEYKERGDENDI